MYNEAIADADISVQHLPNDYNAYLNRGYVYLRMGNYPESINDLTTSLKMKKSQKDSETEELPMLYQKNMILH